MRLSIAEIDRQVAASIRFIGPDTRLVVLPEYFLTGFPMGESIEEWREKAALEPDGPEYQELGKVAERNRVFLSGNAYETDPNFDGLYFQTSFILDPAGELILRYRRLLSQFAPSPYDVWDRYLELYGLDGVFPVADTELGRLACVASEEVLYPEVTRALALRGAELICHSSSEAGSPQLTPKDVAKRARAFENSVYLVSANSAGISNIGIPNESTDGLSKVVDFHGSVAAEAGSGETMVANADVHIDALRHWRRRPGMSNVLSRQCTDLFGKVYAEHGGRPPNGLLDKDGKHRVPDRSYFVSGQAQVIDDLVRRGVI